MEEKELNQERGMTVMEALELLRYCCTDGKCEECAYGCQEKDITEVAFDLVMVLKRSNMELQAENDLMRAKMDYAASVIRGIIEKKNGKTEG